MSPAGSVSAGSRSASTVATSVVSGTDSTSPTEPTQRGLDLRRDGLAVECVAERQPVGREHEDGGSDASP